MFTENKTGVCLLLGFWLVLAANRCQAGSIFDDDYVPPQRETPKADVPPAPAPEPAPTPPPAVNPPDAPTAPVPAPVVDVPRRAVPKPDEQAQCRKLFKEAFADQLKDKSTGGRRKLTNVLLTEAAKTTSTPIDYFVLLSGALQSGEEAGSLKLSFDAIDTLDKSYTFDPLAAKADAAAKVWSTVTPSTATVGNVQNAFDVIDALITDDDFTTAAKVEVALQHGMGNIRDTELKSAAANFVRDFETAHAEREKLKPPLDILKKSPADPAANFAVGSFWCFTAGKWDKGLPYLARGNDATIKNLAAMELLHATDPDAVAKVADGWWDAAAKLTRLGRTRALIHATALYHEVAARLPGLRRLAIEKRVSDVPSTDCARRIDLMELIDPRVDTINGSWRLENGELMSDRGPEMRVEFPYAPPDEYDLRISFVATDGGDAIALICSHAGHQFSWIDGGWNRTLTGFELVDGKRVDTNPTGKRSNRWFANGQRHVCVIKVRNNSVEAYVDEHLINSWKTDYSDIGVDRSMSIKHDDGIGFGAYGTGVMSDFAELIEIHGHGEERR